MAGKKKTKEDTRVNPFRPYLKELRLAYSRIDSSPVNRFDWLLRFAYEDLSALSAGQRSDRIWEMLVFGANGAEPDDFGVDETYRRVFRLTDRGDASWSVWAKDLLNKFQAAMKQNLDAYFSSDGWKHRKAANAETIWYISGDYRILKLPPPPFPLDVLIDVAFDLVKTQCERIRQCERCKKPFVEKRKGRARFCSRKCSGYVKLKKWRQRQK